MCCVLLGLARALGFLFATSLVPSQRDVDVLIVFTVPSCSGVGVANGEAVVSLLFRGVWFCC